MNPKGHLFPAGNHWRNYRNKLIVHAPILRIPVSDFEHPLRPCTLLLWQSPVE